MKKYLTIMTVIIFAANAQTFLFAKDSSKKEVSDIAFEQYLNESKLNSSDFKNLLSDTSFISLEKLLLSPSQKAYNDLTEALPEQNQAQAFESNIKKVNLKAASDSSYSQALPDAYYKIYLDIVKNPNTSPDFNLTEKELSKVISDYKNKIINLLENTYAFKIEKNQNKKLTLSAYLNRIVNENISLLGQYVKANPGVKLYECKEEQNKTLIKTHKDWASAFKHQKMLIEVASLRVIEANLHYAKAGFTYDLALFDIISIARTSATETEVHFNNRELTFTMPKEAYLYVPFGTLKLVSRDAKFMTALQEIEKKKRNPNYDFATKKDSSKPTRGQDYTPAKSSVYQSPYGAGSIK